MIIEPHKNRAILYLSEQRLMYLSRMDYSLEQLNGPSILIMSLDGSLELVDRDKNVSYHSRSFLIPAGTQSVINTNNSILAVCYLDDLGKDLATLKPKMNREISFNGKPSIYSGIPDEHNVLKKAYLIFSSEASAKTALNELNDWIGKPLPNCNIKSDKRIEMAVGIIKENAADNVSVDEIAETLGLSVSHLSQLFKEATGVPIRRYRLWQRLFIVAAKMAGGMRLTEAAISAGFSDSAHFSRVFKEICGVRPTDIWRSKKHSLIHMLAPQECKKVDVLEEIET